MTLPQALNYPAEPLHDDVVKLRQWALDDIDCIRQASTDSRIPKGTTVPARYTPDEGRAFIERQWRRQTDGQGVSLAVVRSDRQLAIGLVVLLIRSPGVAELGYWIVPDSRERGYAARAIGLLSPWALVDGGLARVEARVMVDNEASLRALRTCGFKTEGILRSQMYLDGEHHDMVSLSLVRSDLATSSHTAD